VATYLTQKVLTELKAILIVSKLKPLVSINELQSTSEATGDVLVDISLETVLFSLNKSSTGRDGYERTFLINVHVLANCKNDKLRLFDIVDELENDILKDNELWSTVINRDVVSINFDHGETPYRSATLLVEAVIRLDCTK